MTETPNRPVQEQPPEIKTETTASSPSKSRVGLALWVILLLLLAGAAVWWMQRAQTKAVPNTTSGNLTASPASTDPTATWLTYQSTTPSFSLKYPKDWVKGHGKQASEVVTFVSPETLQTIAEQTAKLNGLNFGPMRDDLAIIYYDKVSDFATPNLPALKNKTISLNDLLAQHATDLAVSDIADTTLGGVPAKEIVLGGESAYFSVLAEKDGHLYELFFSNAMSKQDLTVIEQELLSTFSFTATPTTSSTLQTYTEPTTGMHFQYPATATMNGNAKANPGLSISVSVNNLQTMEDGPSGFDKANIQKDKAALAQNDPSTPFMFGTGYKKETVPGALAKSFAVLQQFEVCDVELNRELFVYKGDAQVWVRWSYATTDIVKNNPAYFTIDQANCGSQQIWAPGNSFLTDVAAGKTDQLSQDWYRSFDAMVKTVRF